MIVFMSCFRPLPAVRDARDPSRVIVCSRSQKLAPTLLPSGEVLEPFQVPCGRCLGCQIDKSIDWATRISCEVLDSSPDLCYFLTLTYNDYHLPTCSLADGITEAATLNPRDMTLFIKRFRSRFPDAKLRYFYAGEYGGKTYRPHYHMISIGVKIPDIKPYSRNFRGDFTFTSDLIDSIWQKGNVVIGDVTWDSCAYVARYTAKKISNKPDFRRLGLEPEFCRMSRRPGIASDYFFKNRERIYQHDEIVLPSTSTGSRVVRPPRFFDKKEAEIDPIRLARFRSARQASVDAANALHTFETGLDLDEYLNQQAELLEDKYKRLKRDTL